MINNRGATTEPSCLEPQFSGINRPSSNAGRAMPFVVAAHHGRLRDRARPRHQSFTSADELTANFKGPRRMRHRVTGAAELMARSITRPTSDGRAELVCPRQFEARCESRKLNRSESHPTCRSKMHRSHRGLLSTSVITACFSMSAAGPSADGVEPGRQQDRRPAVACSISAVPVTSRYRAVCRVPWATG